MYTYTNRTRAPTETVAPTCAETQTLSEADAVSGGITGTDTVGDTDPSTIRNTGTGAITETVIRDADSHRIAATVAGTGGQQMEFQIRAQ